MYRVWYVQIANLDYIVNKNQSEQVQKKSKGRIQAHPDHTHDIKHKKLRKKDRDKREAM